MKLGKAHVFLTLTLPMSLAFPEPAARSEPPNSPLPTMWARPGSASEPRNKGFSPKLTPLAARPCQELKQAPLPQRHFKISV